MVKHSIVIGMAMSTIFVSIYLFLGILVHTGYCKLTGVQIWQFGSFPVLTCTLATGFVDYYSYKHELHSKRRAERE